MNEIDLWDVGTGSPLTRLDSPHDGSAFAVDFSPDGTRIAVLGPVGPSTDIAVFDTTSGHMVAEMKGAMGFPLDCTFSPDGTRLFSWSPDAALRVWDASTGSELLSLRTSGPSEFAVSPDGTRLAVLNWADGTIHIYEADPWWEPGNEPKKPEPVKIEIKPVPEARPAGAGEEAKADAPQF